MQIQILLRSILCLLLSLVLLSSCGRGNDETALPSPTPKGEIVTLELTSPTFKFGESIPAKYSRNNDNLSPPLAWNEPPEGTESLALICDDPDAPSGAWTHGVIFNIPSNVRSLSEAVPSDANLADGSIHGENSWGELGYDGPSPPSGTHRYYFKIFALDAILDLEPGASKDDLLKAIDTHILAYGELMGMYSK